MLSLEKLLADYPDFHRIPLVPWEFSIDVAHGSHEANLNAEMRRTVKWIEENIHLTVTTLIPYRGVYDSDNDWIRIKPIDEHRSELHWTKVLLHEAMHATGHRTRLNRPIIHTPNLFRDFTDSGIEEGVAELAAT